MEHFLNAISTPYEEKCIVIYFPVLITLWEYKRRTDGLVRKQQ